MLKRHWTLISGWLGQTIKYPHTFAPMSKPVISNQIKLYTYDVKIESLSDPRPVQDHLQC